MATDERLTYLEARVDEHSEAIRELRDDIRRLDQKCDLRFDAIDRRFEVGVYMRRRPLGRHPAEFYWIVALQIATMILAVLGILWR